jgi:hypothetical protein
MLKIALQILSNSCDEQMNAVRKCAGTNTSKRQKKLQRCGHGRRTANLADFHRLVQTPNHCGGIINHVVESNSSKALVHEFFLKARKQLTNTA